MLLSYMARRITLGSESLDQCGFPSRTRADYTNKRFALLFLIWKINRYLMVNGLSCDVWNPPLNQ